MNLRHGVIRGAFSLGSARVIVSLMNALGILILARLLVPEDFGIVAIATAITTVVISMTEASLQSALVRGPEPTRQHIDTVWTMSLIRAVIIYGVVAAAAWPVAIAYGDDRLFEVMLVAGLSGAFMDFGNPRIFLATREMRFAPLMMFQILQKAAGLLLALGLALSIGSYWAIIIGNAAGAILASLLSYVLVPYLPRFSLQKVREIWGFSGWLFLTQLCETINWRFDQLAIGTVVSKAQLGFYSVADNLAVIPSRELSMPLRNALFPGLSRLGDQRERIRSAFLEAQTGVAMVTAPAAIGLGVLAAPAVIVLLGESWRPTIPLVQLLCLTYALDTFITVVRPLGMAMDQTRYLFLRQLVALAFRIPLILLGFALGGLVGAAAGRAASSVANCLISFMVAKKLLDIPVTRQLKEHLPTIVSLSAMAAVVAAVQSITAPWLDPQPLLALALFVPLGAAIYVATMLAIWLSMGRPQGALSEAFRVAAGIPGGRFLNRLVRA